MTCSKFFSSRSDQKKRILNVSELTTKDGLNMTEEIIEKLMIPKRLSAFFGTILNQQLLSLPYSARLRAEANLSFKACGIYSERHLAG